MKLWRTNAYCVRYLRSYKAMRWPYKLAAFGPVLAPLFVSLAAMRSQGSTISSEVYWCLAGFMWLILVIQTSLYLRGYLASQQGVQPERPTKQTDLKQEKGRLLTSTLVVALMSLAVATSHVMHQTDTVSVRLLLLFAAVLVHQASTLAHHTFWDIDLDQADTSSLLDGRPSQ